MTDYTVTIKVDPTGLDIGHAFITFSATGQPDVTIGYYPQSGLPIDVGVVRNDAVSVFLKETNTVTEHSYFFSKTFQVGEQQFANMVQYAASVSNNPGDIYNGLFGVPSLASLGVQILFGSASNVCTDFVRGTLAAGDIKPTFGNIGENMLPQSLIPEFWLKGTDQILNNGSYTPGSYSTSINNSMDQISIGIHNYDPTYLPGGALSPTSQQTPQIVPLTPPASASTWLPSSTPLTYADIHTVIIKQGDTLSKIVQDQNNSNNPISADDLMKANELLPGQENNLQIGQRIVVPTKVGNNLVVNYGDVQLSLNSVDGTYQYNINNTASNTTTVYARTLNIATGQYTDHFTETNNASGTVINTATSPVDSTYGYQFNNGAPTTSTFSCTVTDPTGIGYNPAFDPSLAPNAFGTAASGGTWNISADTNTLNNNTDFFSASTSDLLTGGIRPGQFNQGSTSSMLDSFYTYEYSYSVYTKDFWGEHLIDIGVGFGTMDATFACLNPYAFDIYIPADPLVLNLNGDGVKLTSYQDNVVLFDIDHDGGSKEHTGWVAANTTAVAGGINTDGIVVYDLNGNGRIDDISETLSEYFNGAVGTGGNAGTKPYANGFAALKSLDSNSDNQFTSLDAAWNNVKVWIDDNSDGISYKDTNNNGILDAGEASELKTLTELGITSINLSQTVQSGLVNGGNEILASGTFVKSGITQAAQAANFLASPFGQTLTAQGNGTRIDSQTASGAGSASYISHLATGEVMDATALNVSNLSGNAGNDTLTGNAGNNWLTGNLGSDTFNAGAGDDVLIIDAQDLQANIHGGAGNDMAMVVVGDAGVTLNMAQAEIESVVGGRGNDTLYLEDGNDKAWGDEGADTILGGKGNDIINGDNGFQIVAESLHGNDYLDGGDGNDKLYGMGGSKAWGDEQRACMVWQNGNNPRAANDAEYIIQQREMA